MKLNKHSINYLITKLIRVQLNQTKIFRQKIQIDTQYQT